MLLKFTTEQIEQFKEEYANGYECFLKLSADKGKVGLKYPSLKYAADVEGSWKEFWLCFHESREIVYKNMLRRKYKNGNHALRHS
ncbi:hypothetical protein VP424E501_P0002 [Vibrio phage 424E50-1]|nr:hypothetical protein VP424E501_P0002 [Vibrio phage 424E50-1]